MTYIDRSYQLTSWYQGAATQQDYDLLNFIVNNNITDVKYFGQCSFLKSIIKRESTTPQIIVFLANDFFKFSELVNFCNVEIANLTPNSFFYLAINKFLAIPEPHDWVSNDYDDAIYEYIKNKINYNILKYYSGKDDYGQKFNWGHPLTRFYFSNANTI